MSKMFRRIRSPRETRDQKEEKEKSAGANRSYSVGALHANHRRHKSDEVNSVQTISAQNAIYSEPVVASGNGANGHGASALVDDYEGPPLPPRNVLNRPASIGHAHQLRKQMSADEDPYYVAPVDTLRNRKGITNPAVLGDKGAVPTKSERRQMHLHEMTLSQKQVFHTRTGSFDHVIDNSEYSTPWNLIQQEKEKVKEREKLLAAIAAAEKHPQEAEKDEKDKGNAAAAASLKPPPKPQRSSDRTKRTVIQQTLQNHDNDTIIPVHSPSPVPPPQDARSHSSSPTPPPVADNPDTQLEKEDDYDEPWDKKKFPRGIQKISKSLRYSGQSQSGKWKQEGVGDGEVHLPPPSVSPVSGSLRHNSPKMREKFHHGRGASPQPEHLARGTEGERISPPRTGNEIKPHKQQSERLRPAPQSDSSRGPRSLSEKGQGSVGGGRELWGDRSPPLTTDGRSWSGSRGTPVDHLRESSRPYSHSQPPLPPPSRHASEYLPSSTSPEVPPPRTMSYSVPITRRKLPSPPTGVAEDHSDRRYTQTSTSPVCEIDISVPLEEQS